MNTYVICGKTQCGKMRDRSAGSALHNTAFKEAAKIRGGGVNVTPGRGKIVPHNLNKYLIMPCK